MLFTQKNMKNMEKIFSKLTKCRSCGSVNFIKIYKNEPSPVGESFLRKKKFSTFNK